MKIDVILAANRIESNQVQNKVAIVIDTLRATSTMVSALANGVERIIPVVSVEESKNCIKGLEEDYLLAGERNGVKLAGFDLGNSPRVYLERSSKAKGLILTTTNGTKCFAKLEDAAEVIILSLLNSSAVVEYLEQREELVFCCAGVRGEFALDDFLTAGKAIAALKETNNLELSDRALVAYQSYLSNENNLLQVIKSSQSGRNLINLGKEADIDYIVNSLEYQIVPYYQQGEIKL